ncbi:hypothetical protein CDEST_06904 [Colletotrichum destructivum]|uniref:Uncharacterized protein n=1 Tax=Colletotrichum destructivum TaxID=34406 RepID=A0AAX4IEY6_9PEZI|nr:hypothetical protein CDEST_06904 [Colletotrichum destructivum]
MPMPMQLSSFLPLVSGGNAKGAECLSRLTLQGDCLPDRHGNAARDAPPIRVGKVTDPSAVPSLAVSGERNTRGAITPTNGQKTTSPDPALRESMNRDLDHDALGLQRPSPSPSSSSRTKRVLSRGPDTYWGVTHDEGPRPPPSKRGWVGGLVLRRPLLGCKTISAGIVAGHWLRTAEPPMRRILR